MTIIQIPGARQQGKTDFMKALKKLAPYSSHRLYEPALDKACRIKATEGTGAAIQFIERVEGLFEEVFLRNALDRIELQQTIAEAPAPKADCE